MKTLPTPKAAFRQQLHAMAGIYAVLFLLGLETTLGGSILPQAAQALDGIEAFAWLGTGQMLAAACATPVTARLGDIWLRKWLVFLSVVLLCVAGGAAAAAPSMEVLLGSRVLNGLAIGMMAGAAFAVPVDVFPEPAQRVRWQSISGVMFAVASCLGPIVGALLNDLVGWRIALLAVPTVCVPVLLMLVSMPNFQVRQGGRQRLDVLGAVFLSLFIGCSLLGLQQLSKSSVAMLYLILAVVFLLLLWRHQGRVEQPILALEVLQSAQVKLIVLSTLFSGAIVSVLLFYSPLLLTTLTGMSFPQAGVAMLPMLIGMPLGNLINGYLFRKMSRPHLLFCLGSALLLLGMLLLAVIPLQVPLWVVMLGYGLCGMGSGFISQNQSVFIQIVTPRQFAGAATGLGSTARSYGSALGSAVLGLALAWAGLEQGLVIGLVVCVVCALLIVPISFRILANASA